MNAVLTNYALSREFRAELELALNEEPNVISLGELRKNGTKQLILSLRRLKVGALVLAVDDEHGRVLLPILKVLAGIAPAKQRYIFATDLRLRKVSRFTCLAAAMRLLFSSATLRLSVFRAKSETEELMKTERLAVSKIENSQILYLNANLWFGVKAGGSVGHISGVVNGLLANGKRVIFASVSGRLLVKEDAEYIHLNPSNSFGIPWELNYYRFGFDVVSQLANKVSAQKPDFIYQRLSVGNYSGVQLSRMAGVPLVIEYNGSEVWVAKNWGRKLSTQSLGERVEDANLRHAHLVVTVSDVLRDELLERGVPPNRIVSYPNCIDPETFDPARFSLAETNRLRARYSISADAVVVTFVGTFGQWHGASVLATAIRNVLDADEAWVRDANIHFLLVGDGLQMPDVKRNLGTYLESDRVTLAGLVPQNEAPLHLAASDILMSPHVENADGSKFFGSPTKLFEYMAMGKAIVASELDQIGVVLNDGIRPGDYADLTIDSQVSFLTQPGNVEEIAGALKVLAQNSAVRNAIGKNARRLALEKYTWQHHVQAILDALDAL